MFEFIEAKLGKEGIRGFLFALRKSVIGGGEDAYEEAFRMKPDEFDQAFDRYLKERFKPFRDKERPADYGREPRARTRRRPQFTQAFSIAPSPSGDLIAAVTVNRKDRELDIVLLSSKDGSVVRNLTDGFDKDLGSPHRACPASASTRCRGCRGRRRAIGSPTSSAPRRSARSSCRTSLTREIELRIPMKSVDEPESPSFSPDGRTVAFSALRGGIGDIFTVDLATQEIINLTDDDFADYAPTYSPDGKYLVYIARVSGNQKLFRLDLDTKKKTQLTFGTHDESARAVRRRPHASSSRRPPPIRRCRSSRTSPATATSTTSGRSI